MPKALLGSSCLLVCSVAALSSQLKRDCAQQGWRLHAVSSLERALALTQHFQFDAIVIDAQAHDGAGVSVAAQIQRCCAAPVWLLSTQGTGPDWALSEGLAGCVRPPCDWVFQAHLRQVWVDGERRLLTDAQARLLQRLIQAGGDAVARKELAALLPAACGRGGRALDMQISLLRQRLKGAQGATIASVYRYGYRLVTAFSEARVGTQDRTLTLAFAPRDGGQAGPLSKATNQSTPAALAIASGHKPNVLSV